MLLTVYYIHSITSWAIVVNQKGVLWHLPSAFAHG